MAMWHLPRETDAFPWAVVSMGRLTPTACINNTGREWRLDS